MMKFQQGVPSLLILAATFAAGATSAPSTVTTVDCNSGQSLNLTLSKLSKNTPNTVSVSGTCTEYVQVVGFNNLTLKGLPGATLQLPATTTGNLLTSLLLIESSRSVTVDGFSIQADTVTTSAVGIGHGSSDILLRHLNITGGTGGIVVFENSQVSIAFVTAQNPGFAALEAYDSSDVHVEHSVFENSSAAPYVIGLFVGAAHVTMYATTITNMQVGIDAYAGAIIDVLFFNTYYNTGGSTDVAILNPAGTNDNGVEVQGGSSLNVTGANLIISGAGQSYGGTTGGVFITNGAILNASNGLLVIKGSLGQAVLVVNNAHATVTGATITGNAHGGLVAANLSSIDVSTTGTLSTIGGNLVDLFCDSDSTITGGSNIAGAPKRQCANLLSTETVALP